jgi:ABC-type bacteriocin/lantibiotic exporter with double-glycine peptidase domain
MNKKIKQKARIMNEIVTECLEDNPNYDKFEIEFENDENIFVEIRRFNEEYKFINIISQAQGRYRFLRNDYTQLFLETGGFLNIYKEQKKEKNKKWKENHILNLKIIKLWVFILIFVISVLINIFLLIK